MKPIGRQCASGLSLLLSAMRFFKRSAAHGVNGRPFVNPTPTLPKLASGIASRDTFGGAAPLPPRPAVAHGFAQTPDRSGLPSPVLGVGAVRSGFPSGVLGILVAGCSCHCAVSDGGTAAQTAARH